MAAGQTATKTEVAKSRFRLVSPSAAIGLVVLIAVLGVVDVLVTARAQQLQSHAAVPAAFLVSVAALVGLVVAVRQPRNAMGWFLMGAPFSWVVYNLTGTYLILDYRMRHGSLPLGAVAVLLQPISNLMLIALFIFAFLLFPDGVWPSGSLRWVTWTLTVIGVVWVAGALGIAVGAIVEHNIHVDAGGNLLAFKKPRGVWAWYNAFQGLALLAYLASLVLWAIQQIPKYRHSTGDRRLQLKWLYGGAMTTVLLVCGAFAGFASNAGGGPPIFGYMLFVGLAALPISMGVAVLRYRLYEIDRLISRTLSYAVVTGLVVGVYVGIVTLTTKALGFSSPVAVAASTLAAVALFNPLRVRVQRVVDHRFNRARYDAEATVASFTARLRDAVDLETVQTELLEVVNRAVQPAHASVWIKQRD